MLIVLLLTKLQLTGGGIEEDGEASFICDWLAGGGEDKNIEGWLEVGMIKTIGLHKAAHSSI